MRTVILCLIAALIAKETEAICVESCAPAPQAYAAPAPQAYAAPYQIPVVAQAPPQQPPWQEQYIEAAVPAPEYIYIRVPFPATQYDAEPVPAPRSSAPVSAATPVQLGNVLAQRNSSALPSTLPLASNSLAPALLSASPALVQATPPRAPTYLEYDFASKSFSDPSAAVHPSPPRSPTYLQYDFASKSFSDPSAAVHASPPRSPTYIQIDSAPVPSQSDTLNGQAPTPPPAGNVQYGPALRPTLLPPPSRVPLRSAIPAQNPASAPEIVYIQDPFLPSPQNIQYAPAPLSVPCPAPVASPYAARIPAARVPVQVPYQPNYQISAAAPPNTPLQSFSAPGNIEYIQQYAAPSSTCCCNAR